MKSNKSKKIVIILIIVTLLILILSGVAYMYFATDLIRSKKQIFFEYASQIIDEKKGFISNDIIEYYNKIISEPYENSGDLTCNVTDEANQSEYETLNQMNISFDGILDLKNKNFEQNININYSPDVVFPLTVRKLSDTMGVQTKYIGSKYIAENISDIQVQGNLSNNIGNLELSKTINKEQLKVELDKYIEIIDSRLSGDKFSKVDNGYKLTLTYQELNDLEIVLLENLKNDQQLLSNINEMFSTNLTSADIDNIIVELNEDTNNQNDSIDIILYTSNNSLSKIEIKDNDNSFIIEKNSDDENLKYSITLANIEDNENIVFTMEYKGLNSLQNIEETYTLELNIMNSKTKNIETSYQDENESTDNELNSEEDINAELENTNTSNEEDTNIENGSESSEIESNNTNISENDNEETQKIAYKYQLNNKVNFVETANIEELTNRNAIILSEYDQSQVDNLMSSIIERITQVNKEQMEELGLSETENPLLKFIPTMSILNSANSIAESSISELEGIEISAFNAKFEPYQSTNSMGTTTRGLLTVIQTNNEEEGTQKIKEINFDGTEYEVTDQNIVFIKSSIEPESYYRIEFEKDTDTGIIYRVVINKK